jgi:hypothetical protein
MVWTENKLKLKLGIYRNNTGLYEAVPYKAVTKNRIIYSGSILKIMIMVKMEWDNKERISFF